MFIKAIKRLVKSCLDQKNAVVWSNDPRIYQKLVKKCEKFTETEYQQYFDYAEILLDRRINKIGQLLHEQLDRLIVTTDFLKLDIDPRMRLLWFFIRQFYHMQSSIDLIHRLVQTHEKYSSNSVHINVRKHFQHFLGKFLLTKYGFVMKVVLPLVVQLNNDIVPQELSLTVEKLLNLYIKILSYSSELLKKAIFENGFMYCFLLNFYSIYESMDTLDRNDHINFARAVIARIQKDAEFYNSIRVPYPYIQNIVCLIYDTYISDNIQLFTSYEILIERFYKSNVQEFVFWLKFLAGYEETPTFVSRTFKLYFENVLKQLDVHVHRGMPYAILLENLLNKNAAEAAELEKIEKMPQNYASIFQQSLDNAITDYLSKNFYKTVYFYTKFYGTKNVTNISKMLRLHPDCDEVINLMNHFFYIKQMPIYINRRRDSIFEEMRLYQASSSLIDPTISIPINAYIKEHKQNGNNMFDNPEHKITVYLYPESLYRLDDIKFKVPRLFQRAVDATLPNVAIICDGRLRKLQINYKFSTVLFVINYFEHPPIMLECSVPIASILFLFNKHDKLTTKDVEKKTGLSVKYLAFYMSYLIKEKLLIVDRPSRRMPKLMLNKNFVVQTHMKLVDGKYIISDHFNFPYMINRADENKKTAEEDVPKTLAFFKNRLQALIIQILKREKILKDIAELKEFIERYVQDRESSANNRYNYCDAFREYCNEGLNISDLNNIVVGLEKLCYLKYNGQQIVYLV